MVLRGLALFLLTLAGCASLTPLTSQQEQGLAEVRAMADTAARIYQVPRISVLVGEHVQGVGGSYRRGVFSLSPSVLTSRHRDAIVAHELAHYVLGHEQPLRGASRLDVQREQELRELDANAKAVEILTRVTGMDEAKALSLVYDHLLSFHRLLVQQRTVVPSGHRPPCEEIADLLSRFPRHRAWTAALECSGTAAAARGPGAPVPLKTVYPPSRDGSTSDQIRYAYFTDRPPALGTPLWSALNPNLPSGVREFHASEDSAVVLFLALDNVGRSFTIASRWHDDTGAERKVIERVMPQAGMSGAWVWQTHVVAMSELRPYPGRWTVVVSLDGTPAGGYEFRLVSGPP